MTNRSPSEDGGTRRARGALREELARADARAPRPRDGRGRQQHAHAAAQPSQHGAYQYYRRAQMPDDQTSIPDGTDVDRALAELAHEPYAELTVESGRHVAHGSGPTANHESGPTMADGPRRKVDFPKVHPSLRHVLAEVEVDNELDVPTFLRRASE